MASVTESFGSTHKPTLAWATSISGLITIIALVIVIMWVLKRTRKDG